MNCCLLFWRRMADHCCDTDNRRAAIAVHPALRQRSELASTDLSFYTAKSGTPLLYKMREADDAAAENVFMSSPVTRPCITWESSSGAASNLGDDESVFCNKYNVHNCLLYLSQEMTSLGLCSLFTGNSETVDIVRFINNAYHLLKQLHSNEKERSDYNEKIHRLDSEVNTISQANERLKSELDESERSKARLELTVEQLRASNRDLSSKLKVEKDEVRRLDLVMQHRDAQYRHEARKKEQELEKMKERMHRLIADKSKKKAAELTVSSVLQKTKFFNETDFFRTMVGSYEDRQKELLTENGDLRQGLLELQQELLSILRNDNSNSAGNPASCEPNEGKTTKPTSLPVTASAVSDGCFEMPYDVSGNDVLATLKQQCLLLKQHISKIEKNGSCSHLSSLEDDVVSEAESDELLTGSRSDTEKQQVEMLRNKLREYEYVIQQHQQLLMQTIPNETSDVTFLIETSDLDKEDQDFKESYFKDQKAQLEEERQKLVEFAAQLSKQRSEVERMRLEVLHKEFMLLTPFRTMRSAHQSEATFMSCSVRSHSNLSVNMSTPLHSQLTLSAPTTADLFRHLGIDTTMLKRPSLGGVGNIDEFMQATKSAIRNGLKGLVTNIAVTDLTTVAHEDDEKPLSAVKVLQFDQHDDDAEES